MNYVSRCPYESNGRVGVWRCADQKKFVLLCDECQALWLQPDRIAVSEAILPTSAQFILPDSNTSVFGDGAGWATEEEISKIGWKHLIIGKGTALDESL